MTCQFLTTGDIANRWGCSQEFVRYLIRRGKLQAKKHWEKGTHYRVSLDEVLSTEQQLAQSYLDREDITIAAKRLGINRRYAKRYLIFIPEKKEDINTTKGTVIKI